MRVISPYILLRWKIQGRNIISGQLIYATGMENLTKAKDKGIEYPLNAKIPVK